MNASVYVYTCTIYMPGSHRGQKMALESLVMELQMFLSNHVGAGRKTRSFARTIALNCWTTAPGFLTLTYILLDLQKQIPVLAKLFHSHDFESHSMWCLTICKATFSCKSLCYFSLKKKAGEFWLHAQLTFINPAWALQVWLFLSLTILALQ